NAAFTVAADHRSGHLTWTPNKGGGGPKVVFTARNTLTGTATTTIHLHNNTAEPAVADEASPLALALSAAFPNPARDGMALALDLPQSGRVEWAVYDLQGRAWLSEAHDEGAGRVVLRWAPGTGPETGVYFARVRVNGATFTRRFLLVR